jgi:SAM-dependent methyltransferase
MTCPLCASSDTRTVRRYDVSQLIREWESRFHVDVRTEFGDLAKFELRKCGQCDLGYFVPESLAGSPALYAQLQQLDWYYMPRKWEHGVALEDLRGSHRALEVGSGTGDFVALARSEAGLDMEGIELNEAAVFRAQQQGRPVRLADLKDLAKQQAGKYDALCSFQVLEHVPDPGEFLRASCTLLRSGGKLVLGVPDADSYIRHEWNLLDMPPHHMSRWSDRVFRRIQDHFPLRLLRVRREPLAAYHVEGYVDTYLAHWEHYGLPRRIRHSRVRNGVVMCLKRTGAHRLLRGQTVYAFYEKV